MPTVGHVSDVHFTVSHLQPKLIAIDKQPNDDVMQPDRSGKADRLAGETLDPGPQCQMFALDLLRVPLARLVLVGIEMPCICAPIIGVIARDAKRLEQSLVTDGVSFLHTMYSWQYFTN